MKSNRILVSIALLAILTTAIALLYVPSLFWIWRGGEPATADEEYLGLAQVFDGKPKMPVSTVWSA